MKVLGSKYNFLGLSKEHSDNKNSKIVILQAPFEKTPHIGNGTGKAPKEIIAASHKLEYFDEEQNRELCFEKGICSFEPLNFENSSSAKSLEKIYKETAKLLEDDKFIVTIGGEQKISLSTAKAPMEKYPELNVIHFSAHSFLEDGVNCDSTMAQVSEFNKNIIQIGVRSQSAEENRIRRIKGIRAFYAREIKMGMYGEHWQEIISKSAGENVFISFNVDVFDPSFMPTVNNPEPGGLFWDETMNLLKIIGMDKNIVGFEIVGLVPSKNYSSSNYTTAKLVYKILNYAFIER
jgi:agmatinase